MNIESLSKRDLLALVKIYRNNCEFTKHTLKGLIKVSEFDMFCSKISGYIKGAIHGENFFLNQKGKQFVKYNLLKEHIDIPEIFTKYQKELLLRFGDDNVLLLEEIDKMGIEYSKSVAKLIDNGLVELHEDHIELLPKGKIVIKEIDKYMCEEEEENAIEFLKKTDLVLDILKDMDKIIVGETENKFLCFLLFLTKNMSTPQHLLMSGPPSAGKTFVLNNVANYFEDDLERVNRLTAHALDHMEDQDFDGKILLVQEASGAEEAVTIRTLLSGDQRGISILIPEKNQLGGYTTIKKSLKGVPVFATTDIKINIEPQYATRIWNLNIDLTEEQTKEIIKQQKHLDKKPWARKDMKPSFIIKNALKTLEKIDIAIPYLDAIKVPYDKIRIRRDNIKLQTLIKIVTFLHQYQRPKMIIESNGTKEEYLISTLDDMYLAFLIGSVALGTSYMELDKRIIEFRDKIKDLFEKRELVESIDISKQTGFAMPTVRKYMDELIAKGFAYKEPHPETRKKNIYILGEKGPLAEFKFGNLNEIKKSITDYIQDINGTFIYEDKEITEEELENMLVLPGLLYRIIKNPLNTSIFSKDKDIERIIQNIVKDCINSPIIQEILSISNPAPIHLILDRLEDLYNVKRDIGMNILEFMQTHKLIEIRDGKIVKPELERDKKESSN